MRAHFTWFEEKVYFLFNIIHPRVIPWQHSG